MGLSKTGNSSELAMELLQSNAEPSIYSTLIAIATLY